MAEGKFVLVLDCMDGRTQEAAADFAQQKFGDDTYVDTITAAGMDGVLSGRVNYQLPSSTPENPTNREDLLRDIEHEIEISLTKHHASGIVLVGHEDCAGNPVDKAGHRADIIQGVAWINQTIAKNQWASVPVVGVYASQVEGRWAVLEVTAE